jgi:hypothetical protein
LKYTGKKYKACLNLPWEIIGNSETGSSSWQKETYYLCANKDLIYIASVSGDTWHMMVNTLWRVISVYVN